MPSRKSTIRIALGATAVVLGFYGVTAAKPITYACKLDQTSTPGDKMAGVDQIRVDNEEPAVELRVARTVDTAAPLTWRFSNSQSDTLEIRIWNPGERWFGFGVRLAEPFMLEMDGRKLRYAFWPYQGGSSPVWFNFNCDP